MKDCILWSHAVLQRTRTATPTAGHPADLELNYKFAAT